MRWDRLFEFVGRHWPRDKSLERRDKSSAHDAKPTSGSARGTVDGASGKRGGHSGRHRGQPEVGRWSDSRENVTVPGAAGWYRDEGYIYRSPDHQQLSSDRDRADPDRGASRLTDRCQEVAPARAQGRTNVRALPSSHADSPPAAMDPQSEEANIVLERVPAMSASNPKSSDQIASTSPSDSFVSRVLSSYAKSARLPWLLPFEPGPSGIAADRARLHDLEVRAASVVGASHRCEEPAKPRQDAYRVSRSHSGDYLILAVADGISGSSKSDVGATVAVRSAVDFVRSALRGDVRAGAVDFREAFRHASGHIAGAATQAQLNPMEYCCALVVGVIAARPDHDGSYESWFASIADVSVWLRADSLSWRLLAGQSKGDGLSRNELTEYLPFHPDKVTVVQKLLQPGAVVAVVSDGVGDAFTDVPAAPQYFADAWVKPRPMASFLLDVDYDAAGHDDDRTAVVVWCSGK